MPRAATKSVTPAAKPQEEKITINLGCVDLGQIDLLVDEGFYANRTDFIRTAIRRQLDTRAGAVNDTVERRALTLGTQHVSRRELEALREAGRQMELRVLGLATVADDVSPELALATIASAVVAFTVAPIGWWVCGSVGAVALLYLVYLRRQTRIVVVVHLLGGACIRRRGCFP